MEAKTITCFLGVDKSGKTYQANLLHEKLKDQGIKKYSFADGVRDMTYAILGIDFTPNKEEYERFKKEEFYIADTHVNGRDLLINIAMLMRDKDSEYWLGQALDKMYDDKPNHIVIDDMRFDNEIRGLYEYAYYNDYDIEFIYCDYNNTAAHSTEDKTNELALSLSHRCHLDNVTEEVIMKYC